jgi:hypothetical protein
MNSFHSPRLAVNPASPPRYVATVCGDVIAHADTLAEVLAEARACLDGDDTVLWAWGPPARVLAVLRADGEVVPLPRAGLVERRARP